MSDRFSNLNKVIAQPAARLLAMSNAKFDDPIAAPASSDVATVLRELEGSYRPVDMLRLLSVALPVREGVWWACLAGRDIVGDGARAPKTLTTSEKWSFEPSDEARSAARVALDNAEPDDPTVLCAMAVAMSDGTLGPGELTQFEAPAGGTQTAIFGMNMLALAAEPEAYFHKIQVLLERGFDIARGGNGTVDPDSIEARIPPEDPEDDEDDLDDEDDDDDEEDLD